jgi:Na+/H+-dicarboxylate symporter
VIAASQPQQATRPGRLPRFTLTTQILSGLALGTLAGMFFGESATALQALADVYIRLMQMTVLPYLVLTLIAGLGQLNVAGTKRLAIRGGLLLAAICVLALAVIGVMPLSFPHFESASFFSQALLEPKREFALTELYVPANPFNALANSVVPAVVLFSAALGVALIGIPNKDTLLANLRILEQAVMRVTRFVILLTPIGSFAIAATAAGTMDPATFGRLEVYFATFTVAALLLAFVVLPLAVMAVTPFRYREVVQVARDALLTAFVTNSVFIVIPILVERANVLMDKHGMRTLETQSAIEVLVPMAYTFPGAGSMLTLLFVPYAAWFSGNPLGLAGYGSLFGTGVFVSFAPPLVALPFLMDLVSVPQDYFQLYIAATIITSKFVALVAAMGLFAVALIGGAAMTGFLRLRPARFVLNFAAMAAAVAVTVMGTRVVLAATIDTTYSKADVLKGMQLARRAVPVTVRTDTPPPELGQVPALDRIRARGTLRVGFADDKLPFAFFNSRQELVGMDVEVASLLARDLGVAGVEFVPVRSPDTLVRLLAEGRIDVAMSIPYLMDMLPMIIYSAPYFDGVGGFAVKDKDASDFATLDMIRKRGHLTIGVTAERRDVEEMLRERLPGVELRFVALGSLKEFFSGRRPDIDAFATLAEIGSAWSLLYPEYSVVVPQPNPLKFPTGIAMRKGDRDLADYVNAWLVIRKASGELDRAYAYWVLGKGAEERRPRWSILHDVLGWGG